MNAESGLTQIGGVVVVTGPALQTAFLSALAAIKRRKRDGLPTQDYEDLASTYAAALAASGQGDGRLSAMSDPVLMDPPTVPLAKAATRLGMSVRNARRLAEQLGGDKIGGHWLVGETALREHLEGKP